MVEVCGSSAGYPPFSLTASQLLRHGHAMILNDANTILADLRHSSPCFEGRGTNFLRDLR